MPSPRLTPGTGGSKPTSGGRVDAGRPFELWDKGTPLNTPSPHASVLLGRLQRKRPSDGADGGYGFKKRRRISATTPSSSPMVSGRGVLTGPDQRTPVIDITGDDDPQPSSSDCPRRIKSTSNPFLGSTPREAHSAPRYSRSLFSSAPTPGAKRKTEFIDLTIDDGLSAPSSTRPINATQSTAGKNVIGSTSDQNPVAPEPLVDPSRQRSERKHGQARPANSVQQKGATVLTQVQDQVRPPKFGTAFQPDQLTNRSPRAFRNMTAPMNSAHAQHDTKKVLLVNGSNSAFHEREAAKDQLRRGYASVPRVEMQDHTQGNRNIGGETRDVDRKGGARGRVDIGGPNEIESDVDLDENKNFLKTGRFKKQQLLLSCLRPDMFATQPRDSDVAYSDQARNGGNGDHQATETGSAGEGDGSTEPGHSDLGVSVGASQLQKPLVLMNPGQTEKQRKRVADGRADGSNDRGERGSTDLFLEVGRRARDELVPYIPRGSRRRRQMRVVLRAPPDELRRISQRPVQRPDIPVDMTKCLLIMVPLEIQERIYEYLLLADDPIQVLHGWAKLYQRQRSNLHPAILQTCWKIFKNASVFLYGRNVFRYMVRDRPASDAPPSFGQDINVEKYMPLFRKLELKIERSRTEHAYCTSLANAIHLLNTHGADLHTLTVDVSPSVEGDTLSTVGYFYQNGEIVQALKTLRTCFIVVRVLTPKTEDEPAKSLRRKLDMRTELCRFEKAPSQPPETQLDDLSGMITYACESPSEVVEWGWFEEFEVVPQQNERRARAAGITYNDQDDDDVGITDENDDGDDSGDFGVRSHRGSRTT